MHELSIALGIVDIAEKESIKANAQRVETIELEIGTLAGVEFDALDFVWPQAVKNTVLENAHRKINIIESKAKCLECEKHFDLDNYYDSCPKCKSHFKKILSGKELRVIALEVS